MLPTKVLKETVVLQLLVILWKQLVKLFKIDKEYKIYLYSYIREDEYSLYGFKTVEEKELFLKLIGVKGLGPKTLEYLNKLNLYTIQDLIEYYPYRYNIIKISKKQT